MPAFNCFCQYTRRPSAAVLLGSARNPHKYQLPFSCRHKPKCDWACFVHMGCLGARRAHVVSSLCSPGSKSPLSATLVAQGGDKTGHPLLSSCSFSSHMHTQYGVTAASFTALQLCAGGLYSPHCAVSQAIEMVLGSGSDRSSSPSAYPADAQLIHRSDPPLAWPQ